MLYTICYIGCLPACFGRLSGSDINKKIEKLNHAGRRATYIFVRERYASKFKLTIDNSSMCAYLNTIGGLSVSTKSVDDLNGVGELYRTECF